MVLLQQRQKQRVIVVVSIVKGQDDRLFITLEVRKILKKDRLISILGQILQLLLQLRRPGTNKKTSVSRPKYRKQT